MQVLPSVQSADAGPVPVHQPVLSGWLVGHVAQVQLAALVALVQSHVQGQLGREVGGSLVSN